MSDAERDYYEKLLTDSEELTAKAASVIQRLTDQLLEAQKYINALENQYPVKRRDSSPNDAH